MRIIDAHVHIFEHLHGIGWRGEMRATNGVGIWANGERMRVIPEDLGDSSFPVETLYRLLDEYGVEKAVALQGSLYGFANDYVAEAIRASNGRLTGAGSFDPYCLDWRRILDRLTGELGYRIIKLEFSSYGGFMGYHEDFRIDSPRMEPLWQAAREKNLVIVLDIGSADAASYQLKGVASIAGRYPDVAFVVAHLGAPRLQDGDAYRELLKAFAPLENISFDLSALQWNVAPEAAPYPSALNYLKQAHEVFGSKRLLWGSDVPCVMTKFPYTELWRLVTDFGVFSREEQDDVLYGNADRIYFGS